MQLIARAKTGERQAQKAIYKKYAPKMLSLCRQYIKDVHFAEDVMIAGFTKVFEKLRAFESKGSFEGWIRKIMVHQSISHLRKKQFVVYDDVVFDHQVGETVHQSSLWDVEHIQLMIDQLPEGYRAVFLLYAVEGYKHHEIADLLQISTGTSKSQLFKARKLLQENLKLSGTASQAKEINGK